MNLSFNYHLSDGVVSVLSVNYFPSDGVIIVLGANVHPSHIVFNVLMRHSTRHFVMGAGSKMEIFRAKKEKNLQIRTLKFAQGQDS